MLPESVEAVLELDNEWRLEYFETTGRKKKKPRMPPLNITGDSDEDAMTKRPKGNLEVRWL